ncbi:MAG TPA: alginate lyase family protein [Chitinophagaceae bacterium]|nr:alginate lyase family protein [Chitinophagaceae bacterium]
MLEAIGEQIAYLGSMRLVLFFVLCFSTALVKAQQKTRLIGNWEFLRQDLGGIWEAVRPVGAGNPESVPLWQKVELPHCVNARDAVDPDVNYYQGPSWYRTQLDIKNPYANGRTLLHFEGAGQKTDVYVYTTKVGSHIGGYDEFTIDITEAVAAFQKTDAFTKQFKGKIPISIRTDNSRDLELVPSDLSDFNLYGGIYRYLNLVYVPEVSIDKLFIRPTLANGRKTAKLHVNTRLYNPHNISGAKLSIRLFDPRGKLLAQTADSNITVNAPQLWSTDKPVLYTVEATITTANGSHTQIEKIGFRDFEFIKKGPFHLNGARLLLRGTHRHEDHAGVAAAMTEDMMRREMIMMKEMGVNFIRLGHYQQSRIILDLCDSLGILVWEEIPWCRGGLGGDVYKQRARDMLVNMIEQHYNHPSIIIWGLGNENDWPGDFPEFDKEKIRTFMKELNDLSHKLDSSRKTAIRRCDFCKDIVDVYSPSIWAGWYRGIYTEYKQVSEAEMQKVDHFLHVEWGGDSHAGRHSENPDKALQSVKTGGGADERAGDASLYGGAARVSKDGDWSESYICNLIDWHLKEQETMPWLTGTAQWPFQDFSTPVRPDNPVPYMNQKGVVERDLTKKEAYYVFQSYWTTTPMVHIYGHSFPVRWGDEGEAKMIKVYSNCDAVELFVDGKSYGVKKRNSQDFPAAGLRWLVNLSKGPHQVRAVATKGKMQVRDSISFHYQTEKWGKPAKLVMEKIADANDTATVQVRLLDKNNVQCLDARNWIRFALAGDGQLIDDLGTSSGSRYVQMYNGRAIISIKTNGGKSVVSAKSDSVASVFIDLAAAPFYRASAAVLKDGIMKQAEWALLQQPVTVTAATSPRSAGGKHDFYSEGDYWWPNPKSADSPYVQRDGMTNPDNFVAHRLAMIRLSTIMGALASAYKLTGDEKYVRHALKHANAWFADTATRMNPNLQFAQAIKGRATGRGIGIIDTIHLLEVVQSLLVIEPVAGKASIDAIRNWYAEYLRWLTTHKYGIDEMNAANNHGTCWVMQVAAFARFTGDTTLMNFCRNRYKTVLLPSQMAADGSFPRELARTKPYGYSIFNLDAMAMICQVLSSSTDDLWNYETADGRSIRKGIEFLYPFIAAKSKWTYNKDVMYWEDWPVAQPFLLFGANAFNDEQWFRTWEQLEHFPAVPEVVRNLPVRNPLIWQ